MIYLGIASYSEEQKTELDIDNIYMKGERFSDSVKFDESAEACMKIIQMDKTQEKAWHELGKHYNRFEKRDESVSRYDDYLRLFPHSSKAREGHDIAKEC